MYVPEGARVWHGQGPIHRREQVLVPTPGGFESLKLLQECGELLLLRWRQVPQSCLLPESTLRELAAAEMQAGVRQASHGVGAGPTDNPC